MSDITKCPGTDCPMKEKCKRFTEPSNKFHQSYFLDPPYEKNDTYFKCDMYWGDKAEVIWNDLKEATGISLPE